MTDELAHFQGEWKIVQLEVEGTEMDRSLFQGAKIVIDGSKFTSISMGDTYEGTIKFDSSENPKQFDLTFEAGPHAGKSSLAIYQFESDVWKLCLCLAGGVRPTDFVTSPGTGHVLEVLKRSKPEIVDRTSETKVRNQEEIWSMIYGERDGQMLPEGMIASGKRIVQGDQVTVTFGGQVMMHASCAFDLTQNPSHVDYTLLAGPLSGKKQLGIFEKSGSLARLCFSNPGKARPSRFTTEAGDETTFTVWKLEKEGRIDTR